jgi:hypothetical protein
MYLFHKQTPCPWNNLFQPKVLFVLFSLPTIVTFVCTFCKALIWEVLHCNYLYLPNISFYPDCNSFEKWRKILFVFEFQTHMSHSNLHMNGFWIHAFVHLSQGTFQFVRWRLEYISGLFLLKWLSNFSSKNCKGVCKSHCQG